jgi:patatin-like phospholipase/acyl hydrolase
MNKLAVSIDGGGIKGVVPAYIFTYLEERLGSALPIAYVGGTSTGSILGAGLATGIPAEKLLSFYLQDGPRIFGTPSWKYKLKTLNGLKGAKYDTQIFQDILLEKLGPGLLKDVKIPFLCTAFNMSKGLPELFTSTTTPNVRLVDVVAASSAAPTYFAPKIINGDSYIDGGMYANNPSLAVFTKAKEMYGVLAKDLTLLSVGTGSRLESYSNMDGWVKYQWIQPLLDIMMASDNAYTDSMINSLYGSVEKDDNYFRLNQPLPAKMSSAMDDASAENLQNLVEFAEYIVCKNTKVIDAFLEKIR